MILEQLKLSSKSSVEIEVSNANIIIKPEARQGWAEAARLMNAAGDDEALLSDIPNDFDNEEWTW